MRLPFFAMSAIKDGRYPVELDKQRHMLFSLNAIDEIEDKFGGIENLTSVMNGPDRWKNIRWLLALLINEGKDDNEEALDEKKVGRLLHAGNIKQVTNDILAAFAWGNRGTTEPLETDDEEDEDGEDDAKNTRAGRED